MAKRELTTDQWAEKVENLIYAAQDKLIRHECGKAAADNANYGWGVDGSDTTVIVETKVYGDNGGVLVSSATYPSLTIEHDWRD